ncbi:MAG: NAD(P)H-quinone oxidoreductase subunit 3 [Myxococcales bacterium]|nr:NAD(P)H-quinone oxidoreductase subunit 3 [Myxococcales bacterium]
MGFELAMVLGFFVVSGLALWALLFVGRFLRLRAPRPEKLTTYECGELPVGPAWFNFNNRFYLVALVFVALDVGVAAAIPLVVILREAAAGSGGWLVFLLLFGFLLLLAVALAYVWKKGDLRWLRDLPAPECAPVDTGRPEPKP